VKVKVILDSINKAGQRLTTIECTYWRAIHGEVMTHRSFARNAASSRAIPFLRELNCPVCNGDVNGNGENCVICDGRGKVVSPNCTYWKLKNKPYIPKYIGAEKKGMQAGSELTGEDRELAEKIIWEMSQYSVERCKQLYDLGVHKSIINRYLEPWTLMTTIITATEWDNFFTLRCHPEAERHFNELATQIRDALAASTPELLEVGAWHTPYLMDKGQLILEGRSVDEMKDISVARCARVSFLTHDGVRSVESDLDLAARLKNPGLGAFHASPFEHVAQSAPDTVSGPFIGWRQYRKDFPNG
jgi:thymidylate synthase ThyX